MQGRSWMAALTLVAASAAAFGPSTLAGQPTPIKQTVKLSLRLDGIARDGGEVVDQAGPPRLPVQADHRAGQRRTTA